MKAVPFCIVRAPKHDNKDELAELAHDRESWRATTHESAVYDIPVTPARRANTRRRAQAARVQVGLNGTSTTTCMSPVPMGGTVMLFLIARFI